MVKADNVPTPDDPEREDDNNALRSLFMHYEYIAAGVYCGGLDERVIKECEIRNVVALYKYTTSYVDDLRNLRRKYDPKFADIIYENFQRLARRWDSLPPRLCDRLVEWFLMRPLRRP